MELRHLRYFVAAAEELNFRRAAARLNISQPPLSQQIRALEAEIGVDLFRRVRRSVQLTDAGRQFLQEARRILHQAERAVRSVQRTSRGEVGLLAIGFVSAADFAVLPHLLPRFQRRFPDVQLVLRTISGAAQADALRDGRIDVGFLRLPVEDDGLVVESLLKEPLVVALPRRHPLAARRTIAIRSLAKERHIFFARDVAPSYHDLVVSYCRVAGFTLNITHEADHIQTSLSLIAGGVGVSLLPASVRNIERPGIVCRPLRPPVPYVEMGMAYRADNDSNVLRVFAEMAREWARALARGGPAAMLTGRPAPARRGQALIDRG